MLLLSLQGFLIITKIFHLLNETIIYHDKIFMIMKYLRNRIFQKNSFLFLGEDVDENEIVEDEEDMSEVLKPENDAQVTQQQQQDDKTAQHIQQTLEDNQTVIDDDDGSELEADKDDADIIEAAAAREHQHLEQQVKSGKSALELLASSVNLTVTKKLSTSPGEKSKDGGAGGNTLASGEGKDGGDSRDASRGGAKKKEDVQITKVKVKDTESLTGDKKRKHSEDNISDTAPGSDAELTISRVKRINKDGVRGSSGSSSGTSTPGTASSGSSQHQRRPSQTTSPAASGSSSSGASGHTKPPAPPYLPRFPGMRPGGGFHPNRGGPPMMPMLGPNGMMVRGPPPFRGPGMGARPAHPPPSSQPSGPLNLPPNLPSAAGPVAEQLNKVANKLADTLKRHFQDSLSTVNTELEENPQGAIKRMKVEIERAEWKHQQELAEMKHNADLVIMEMRQAMEAEKQKALQDCKKQAEIEKQTAIKEMKKKQWCAHCGKEAIFYCCWNTSYCDYPCQQAHWPTHMNTCAQNTARTEEAAEHQQQQSMVPDPITMQHQYMQHHQQMAAAQAAAAASRNAAAAAARHSMMMAAGSGAAGGGMMRFMRPPGRMGGGAAAAHHMAGYPRPYFM